MRLKKLYPTWFLFLGNLAVGAGNNVIRIPPSSLTALAGIAAIAVPTAIIGATTAGQNNGLTL